ncbi:MAG: hypothetical protein R2795_04990 [Saprospiraceae bacterium]
MGGGSNVILLTLPGLTLLNRVANLDWQPAGHDTVEVTVGSGMNWHQFVLCTLQQGFGGVENLALIPGDRGGGSHPKHWCLWRGNQRCTYFRGGNPMGRTGRMPLSNGGLPVWVQGFCF